MEIVFSGVIKNFTLKENVFDCKGRNLEKSMKPLTSPTMSLIVLLLFFYKDGFGIK